MQTTNKTATTSRAALVSTQGYKAAVAVFSNGKTHKYTEALALYLQPQGATSGEVEAYYRANGKLAEPMLNCYRKAAASEHAELVEQTRTVKGSTKTYKAYTLALTAKGKAALTERTKAAPKAKAKAAPKAKAKAKATRLPKAVAKTA